MPCDSVYTIKVQFGHNTDLDLLSKSLAELGYENIAVYEVNGVKMLRAQKNWRTVTFNSETGEFERQSNNYSFDANEISEAYSRHTAVHAAEQMGWTVEWVETEEGENKRARLRRSAY